MNCAECQENMVAHAEGFLDPEKSLLHEHHLENCAECRVDYAALVGLRERLMLHAERAAGVSLMEPVMGRIMAVQKKPQT